MGSGYYKDTSGKWKRIPGKRIANCYIGVTANDKNESEDTRTRKDINGIIRGMAEQKKSSIEIKLILSEKYPNYEEYIIKMINQYFGKPNKTKNSNVEMGDER